MWLFKYYIQKERLVTSGTSYFQERVFVSTSVHRNIYSIMLKKGLKKSNVSLVSHFIWKFAGVIFQRLCALSILGGRMDIENFPKFSFVEIINRSNERTLLYRTEGGWQQNVIRIVVTCAFNGGNWYLHVAGRPKIRWVNHIQGGLRTMKTNNWTKMHRRES
jgi:hypothetical protein